MSIEERLAVVEVTVADIKSDVSEMRGDVKVLLARSAARDAFASLGKYIIPFLAVVIAVASLFVNIGRA